MTRGESRSGGERAATRTLEAAQVALLVVAVSLLAAAALAMTQIPGLTAGICVASALALDALVALGGADSREISPMEGLLDQALRERFIVTLATGESFSALLDQVDTHTVVLVDASVMLADGALKSVDGQLYLRRDAIAYMQRP